MSAPFLPDDGGPDGIGCYECDGGWRHGCLDDLCLNRFEAVACEDARPCRHCNSHGEAAL